MANFGAHSVTIAEIKHLRKNFNKWAMAEKVETPMSNLIVKLSVGIGLLSGGI